MAKKEKHPPVKRAPTHGELVKWKREGRRQHWILVGGVLAIVAVVAMVAYGYYARVYKPDRAESNKLQQTVLKVGNKDFSLRYVTDILNFYAAQSQTAPQTYMFDTVVKLLEYNELLNQAPADLGLALKPGELDAQIKTIVMPSGPPASDFNTYYKQQLLRLQLTDREFRDIVTADLQRTKLTDYYTAKVPSSTDQVHVQGILTTKNSVAAIGDRLVYTGDTFSAVVTDASLDSTSKSKGGDLGWIAPGERGPQFDSVAFNLQPGILSQPLTDETNASPGAVWLVNVLEKQSGRAVDDTQKQSIATRAVSQWFTDQAQSETSAGNIVVAFTDAQKTWALNYLNTHPKPTAAQ